MTNVDLEQIIRKVIREETVSKEELHAAENRIKAESKAAEERIKREVNANVEIKVEGIAEDMAELFHKTWEKMDETNQENNERLTIIEDHLGLSRQSKN